MRKIIFSLVAIVFTATSFAQTITKDTVEKVCTNKGSLNTILSDIVNNTSSPVTLTWNMTTNNLASLSGWTGTGICAIPGNCYAFNNASHSITIPANSTGQIQVDITLDATAVDGIGYVTVNTSAGNMTFKYVTCPLNTNDLDYSNFVNIYPNPANNYININFNNKEISSITVMNVVGRKIAKFEVDTDRSPVRVPLDNISNGVYLLQFADAKGKLVGVKKVTKQ